MVDGMLLNVTKFLSEHPGRESEYGDALRWMRMFGMCNSNTVP